MAPQATPSTALLVESGVHRTARSALSHGCNRIGSSADNDIVISDLPPGGTAFLLTCENGRTTIEARDATVDLSGRKVLQAGRSRRLPPGASFTSCGVSFRLDGSALALPARQRASLVANHLPAFVIGVLCTGMLSLVASLNAAPALHPVERSIETTGSIPAARPVILPEVSAVVDAFRQKLATTGLEAVTLKAEPDGSIEARGQITPQQAGAWHEASRWFDGAAGGVTVLVDQVSVASDPPPLTVQAVWPGRNPYVIDGSGGKLFIGAILPSGWVVSAIDATRVTIKRGDQITAVRF
ncbi:hypothetical protein LGH83_19180 [Lichenihabitans sp. PAMC28606]|uniref:SctD/MshK family protein n=1 Tax=Lichenihabitans sp. PAMC28606 TaxID=2880932 RepID=UPI001D09E387|nr:hypothetical protein [Lichenihabitans sp. PAMC28606]UDL94590.1 hypothetical protein LGH83_19180 [Lichenihabitans sp. PAMC28606]